MTKSTGSPLVSVCVPVYNAAPYLGDTLESVLGQTWPNVQIVVVDDGSTDESLDVARSFECDGVTVIAQENQGASAARNRALRDADGEYIQFLDADDLLPPHKIERQIQRLQNEPGGTVASTAWERFYDTPGDYEPLNKSKAGWGNFRNPLDWLLLLAEGCTMMPPVAWLTPRSVIERAGPWNESLSLNDDGEYFTRVLLEGEKIAFCGETQVYYRSGREESLSNQQDPDALRSWYKSLRLTEQYLLDREESPRVRQACAKQLEQFIHGAYPDVPNLIERAHERVEDLGATFSPPNGSLKYNLLIRLFGWKNAKKLRRHYYRFRYGKKL